MKRTIIVQEDKMSKWETATRLLDLSKQKIAVVVIGLLCCVFTGLYAQTTLTAETGTGSALLSEKITAESPKTDREDVVLSYDLESYSNSIGTGAAVSFEASAKFTPAELAAHAGRRLNKVSIFLGKDTDPTVAWSSVAVKVYKGTAANAPLTELCNFPITNAQPAVWTVVDISALGIVIEPDTDYWIGYAIEATGGYPLGCDAGPVVAGKGQWIKYNGAWSELAALNSSLTYNWHIRLSVQAQTYANDLAITAVSAPTNNIFVNTPVTLSATVKNSGTDDAFGTVVTFNIDGAPVGTATVDYMTPEQTTTLTYNWTATAGKHTYSASVPADDFNTNNSKSTPIKVFRQNQLVEGFEDALFPPQYWSSEIGWTRNPTGGLNDGPIVYWMNPTADYNNKKLVTSRVVIASGDSLSFYVSNPNAYLNNIQVKASLDGINWTDCGAPISTATFGTILTYCAVSLNSLTVGNVYYLALSPSGTLNNYIFIDNIVGPDKYMPTSPEFVVTPTSNDYGTVMESFPETKSFTIKNIGGATLTINGPDGIKITGTDASQFIVDSIAYPINLDREESSVFAVDFSPTSSGAKTAAIEITDNISKAIHSIPLTGTGIALINSFTENFDTVTQPALPSDWTALKTGSADNAVIATYTTLNYSAPNSVRIFNGSTNVGSLMLVTPALGKINENQLSFRSRGATNGYSLIVGTLTDPANADTFTPFQTLTLTNTFDLYTVNFVPYTGTNKYIAFKHGQLAATQPIFLDNVQYGPAPEIPIFSITPTNQNFTATLTTQDTKSFTIKNIGLGTLVINNGDISISGTNSNEFLLGAITYPISLTQNQTYSFNVTLTPISLGLKNAVLNIADNIAKQTNTVALTGEVSLVIFSENFEATTFPPTGWTISNQDNSTTWTSKAAAGNGISTKAAFIDLFHYSPSSGQIDNLISPVINLNTLSVATLKFNVAYRQYTTENDGLNVFISIDGGSNFILLYNKSGATLATLPASNAVFVPANAADWRMETVDLTPYIGNSNAVLYFQSVNQYGNNLYLDDITVNAVPHPSSIVENIPTTLTLSQNYPNPFNPSTTINFTLPANSKVELSVYNAKGELVKELVNSQLKSGVHKVTFDGSGLNSGMYFYKLNTPEKSLTKKMIMIK